MKPWWLAALWMVPLATGAVGVEQGATITSTSQETFAPLSSGDVGTATVGASGTSADITVGTLPLITADDILDLSSTDNAWNVHAELVSFSGFGLLESVTLALRDGTSTETQISIVDGVALTSTGTAVDLPTSQDTELTAIGAGSGTVTFDLILERDAGSSPVVTYRCTLTV